LAAATARPAPTTDRARQGPNTRQAEQTLAEEELNQEFGSHFGHRTGCRTPRSSAHTADHFSAVTRRPFVVPRTHSTRQSRTCPARGSANARSAADPDARGAMRARGRGGGMAATVTGRGLRPDGVDTAEHAS
jgi:hypothetical protein